jgi:hypothetical protein
VHFRLFAINNKKIYRINQVYIINHHITLWSYNMKQLFALLVLVSFFTYAQHIDIVNQTGSGNVSTVDQGFMDSGPGLPGNEAYIDQIGNRNSSDVDQFNGGFAGDAHWTKVWSQGNDNVVRVFQERSAGDADVYQVGNLNTTIVWQSGNFGSSTNYTPGIDAHAYSIGNNNVELITMWGTNVTAYAHQIGDNNRIHQNMGSGMGEKVQDSDFEAHQEGNRNQAYQLMDGQGFSGGITAVGNFGTIYTDGNDNYALQYMEEGSFPAANNYANALQLGNLNVSQQFQTGAGNSSTHTQVGNSNTSLTTQN